MKILYLTPGCFDKGGISRYNRYQIKALRELFGNDHIKVLSLLGPDEEAFESPFSVTWHGDSNGRSKLRFILQTIHHIISWRPDVIHVAHVNFSGLAVVLARIFRLKSVLNVYGLEVWSGLSKDAELGLKSIDHVISDCHYTAHYLESEGYRTPNTTTVIWDCVDLELFKPQPDEWPRIKKTYNLPDRNDHFIILTLGRLAFEAAHKGYDRLICVFANLIQVYPNARLVIAGKGNMKERLQQQVSQIGLEDKVVFTGMVPDQDLPALYSYAHVFSLVSDRGKGRGEGIPLTPLEAMACQVPIVVGNHDGSQEAILHNNGLVIDPFNQSEHQKYFETLISNSVLQNEQAESALNTAHLVFGFQSFKTKLQLFFASIC